MRCGFCKSRPAQGCRKEEDRNMMQAFRLFALTIRGRKANLMGSCAMKGGRAGVLLVMQTDTSGTSGDDFEELGELALLFCCASCATCFLMCIVLLRIASCRDLLHMSRAKYASI